VQGFAQVGVVEVGGVRDLGQDVRRADVAVLDEVGAVDALAERGFRGLLPGPERSLVGGAGVVPVAALPDLEPLLRGALAELGAALGKLLRRPGDELALGRDPRMEVKGTVLDCDVEFGLQSFDPSLADIAPGSDEVAVHHHGCRRHGRTSRAFASS
jgi:hypothetical protein